MPEATQQTFSYDPSARSYRKIRSIYETAGTLGVDWRDETNDMRLADIAFMCQPRAFGPEPSQMPIEKIRLSWLDYARRLRTVQLPEMAALLGDDQ